MIKYIHPKTGVVRDVEGKNVNKIRLLERADFVPLEGYKPPKKPKVVAEKTIADAVEDNKIDPEDAESDGSEPELAIHMSAPARRLVEKEGLDPGAIEGTGKDGQITKPDVKDYLAAQEEKEPEKESVAERAPEAPVAAEDILTHDDPPEAVEAPETAPEEDPGPEGEPEMVGDGSSEVDPPADEPSGSDLEAEEEAD